MIEIRIIEQPDQWVALVIQKTAIVSTRPIRTLQKSFATAGEAWLWAKGIVNQYRKENPHDEGGDRRPM